jgi:peptidyl-prolyl cis-trans isomerase B (cyclophilin B)
MKKAKITLKKGGEVLIDLLPEEAPNTVANFEKLASEGFYNDIKFHRVIPGFVAQAGCPHGLGTGGAGYTIKCETDTNVSKHVRGTLSMAHAGKDTGSSQFFICFDPQPHLDKRHTIFGIVTDGLDVVDQIKQGDEMENITVWDE